MTRKVSVNFRAFRGQRMQRITCGIGEICGQNFRVILRSFRPSGLLLTTADCRLNAVVYILGKSCHFAAP